MLGRSVVEANYHMNYSRTSYFYRKQALKYVILTIKACGVRSEF